MCQCVTANYLLVLRCIGKPQSICISSIFYILQALRNHRYGRRTLDLLAECGKTLILEIDPSMDAIVCRRKMFYERCGFAENPFPHIHPPYHAENRGHALVVMTIFLPIPQEKYNDFYRYLTEKVLKDVF